MRRTSTSLDAFWPRVFIQGGGVYTGWLAMFAHKSFRLQNAFQLLLKPPFSPIRGGLQEWSCDQGGWRYLAAQTIIEISGIC